MVIHTITNYPIKSTRGTVLSHAKIMPYGLEYDRNWALFDANFNIITARQFQGLLSISVSIDEDNLNIFRDDALALTVPLKAGKPFEGLNVFKETALGYDTLDSAHLFFSSFLKIDCFFIFMGNDFARSVAPKYGGKSGDVVGYADECPILLISNASLQDLNARLQTPVTMQHFRPNLTIEGCVAYEEDTWKKIRIGQCEFDVSQQCKRCVVTTIDPITRTKSPQQEPLRTLSSYRKHPRGGTPFGVHLIPRKTGEIKINDKVEILNS